jgi:hypothetical protein
MPIEPKEEIIVFDCRESTQSQMTEIMRLIIGEVTAVIFKYLNAKKDPGYDLIIGRILRELSKLNLTYFIQLFNSILTVGYFPSQWKVVQIIIILKPNKDPVNVKSYRPISLLSIISKLAEKLFFQKLMSTIAEGRPNH